VAEAGNGHFFCTTARAMRRALEGIAVAGIRNRAIAISSSWKIPLNSNWRCAVCNKFSEFRILPSASGQLEPQDFGQVMPGRRFANLRNGVDEIRTESFSTFAVRAKRSDKRSRTIHVLEREVGGVLLTNSKRRDARQKSIWIILN